MNKLPYGYYGFSRPYMRSNYAMGVNCNDNDYLCKLGSWFNVNVLGVKDMSPPKQDNSSIPNGLNITKRPTKADKSKFSLQHGDQTKSGEVVDIFSSSKGDPNRPYVGETTSNSSSGCQNCKYGDFTCEILKAGCEAQHVVLSGLNSVGINGDNAKIALLGIAAVLVVVLIAKR